MQHIDSTKYLEQILLPGTPHAVAKMYAQLASEASTRDFGLLEEDLVVLDTETTGLSFRDNELIEIAAARLQGREIVERFHSYVCPTGPIPAEIVELTGIRQVDVQDAPSAQEVVAELASFVGGAPVLAHNMSFDRGFIERVSGGGEVSDIWVDTLALSRIALPRLSSHKLADLAAGFGCDSVSHRAMDDVEALAGVWRVLLCALSHLPDGLCGLLASMHKDVSWSMRPILAHLALEKPEAKFSLEEVRKNLLSTSKEEARLDPADLIPPILGPSAAEIAEEFEPGATISKMYANYEKRPEQLAMAKQVLKAFKSSMHLAAEAGTGVGKSVAYLLPAVRFAKANGISVGVATKTNALTDQLVSQELPALQKALGGELSYTSLKGYEHYPCLRKLLRATEADLPEIAGSDRGVSRNTVQSDMLTAIAVVLAFVSQSPEGDLDALGIRWKSVPRELLTTTPEQCIHAKCPFFPDKCLIHGARRRAACSDIVVTNHSLLLRNVEAEGRILPPIRHWIVDEAHSLEQEARRQWAKEFTADKVRGAFESLGGVKSGAIHALLVHTAGMEASALIMGLLTKAAAQLSRASVATADLIDEIRELKHHASFGGYDTSVLWIGEEIRQTPEWAVVCEVGERAIERLEEACKSLDEANSAITEALENPPSDLSDATRTLKDVAHTCKLVVGASDESYVYSARLSRRERNSGEDGLVAEKLDIGSELAQRWYPETMSAVFTSATMAVGDDFSHFTKATGLAQLDQALYYCVQLDSSYDFDSAMSVVVAKDLPDPRTPAYLDQLVELLYDVHVSMDGSVLTLFTNRREMEQAYERLRPRLGEHGLELMMQERRASARNLRNKFLSETSSSLFALKSFWEGFDAGGRTLRCVVIPKLPFTSPNDPLSRERERREDRAWWNYSLPEAVLSVKQAAGRLIRTSSDTGILVLADSRLVSKRYGKAFINSMPSHTNLALSSSEIGRYIVMWRRTHD